MKIENIEDVRILISRRSTLVDVVEKSERWKNGHFEFAEHCGDYPNRVIITYFPELEKQIIELIKKEIAKIEKELETK